jgi:hypothetical protein
MADNTLERYRLDASRLTEQLVLGDLLPGEMLETAVCALIQRYVAHDMEWAALAVEEADHLLTDEAGSDVPSGEVSAVLDRVVASIRARGRVA